MRNPTRERGVDWAGETCFFELARKFGDKKGGEGGDEGIDKFLPGWCRWDRKKKQLFPGHTNWQLFPGLFVLCICHEGLKGSKMNKFFRGWQINKFFPGRKKNKFFPSCEKKTGKSCFFFSWDVSKKESNRWRCCMSCRIKDEILLFSGSNQVCYFSNNTNVFLWFYLSYFSMFHVHTLSNCLNILIHSISWKVERKLG